jgi:hypothetical protein
MEKTNTHKAAWVEPNVEFLDVRQTESGWGSLANDGGDWSDAGADQGNES